MASLDDQQLIHRIALASLKGIGPVNARNLVAYCGGVEPLFTDKAVRRSLEKVPGIGPVLAASIRGSRAMQQAEQELAYVRKHGLRVLFYLDEGYPRRLRLCDDAPVVLYAKGTGDLDRARTIAIVGTRTPTEHGRRTCAALVEGLAESGATIISGLAYGIDIVAHRTALAQGLETIGCLAHGLDRLYPGAHAATARELCAQGALVSELPSGTPFVPGNFPARNRVIAGLSDATIVIESGHKGGSLITADIANSYDREVMAFPGRPSDPKSTGCNRLIKNNQAHLVTGAEDVLKLMGWLPKASAKPAAQPVLFQELLPEERLLVDVLRTKDKVDIDTLCAESKVPAHQAAGLLLNLELNGMVLALPGKMYAMGRPA